MAGDGNASRRDGRIELVSCRLERFRKRLRSSRKRPDQNSGGLQNHLRDINGLAQNPIGYRYTIPHKPLILRRFLSNLLQMASQIVPII
jgi:hypothetical protein